MHGAGIAFVTPDRRALFLKRGGGGDFPGHWCFPGGSIEAGETPAQAAVRETKEEAGYLAPELPNTPIITEVGGVRFSTFVVREPGGPFNVTLSDESTAFEWASIDKPPQPIHPGVAEALGYLAKPVDFDDGEEYRRASSGASSREWYGMDAAFAFDKSSVRSTDADGRLHVARTRISKANVCPYIGREIPNFEALGLQPGKVYRLLRDPEELRKGAPTFNNIPLLGDHIPVSAENHRPDVVVGSMGTDAEFDGVYLWNSLVVWAADAIHDVESEAKKELSSAYRYRADMTPGEFNGERYDGVMRDIVGNHVALVKEGRAGPDVVVGDSKERVKDMPKVKLNALGAAAHGAIAAFLKPKMAMDAKIDLRPVFVGLTAKTLTSDRDKLVSKITQAIEGKLAQDASAEGLATLLEALSGEGPAIEADADPTADPTDPPAGGGELPMDPPKGEGGDPPPAAGAGEGGEGGEGAGDPGAGGADPIATIKEFLSGKLTPEDLATFEQMLSGLGADEEDDEARRKAEKEEGEKDMVSKPAMDAAISAALNTERDRQKAIREAERAVRPHVGEIGMACDSAAAVYRAALGMLKVPGLDKVEDSALAALWGAVPKPGDKPAQVSREKIAQDAAAAKGFAERYKGAADIRVL